MEQALERPKFRIESIDILRGIIMLIMALDHVRDYVHITAFTDSPTNLATTTPSLFFTRWITHFCAPLFVFLSGLSAWQAGTRRTKKELSVFLIKRGIWLIVVELVIMTFIVTFNPLYNFILLAVIWAIGWSMIILGLLVRASYKTILIIGILVVIAHNLTDLFSPVQKEPYAFFYRVFIAGAGTVYTVGSRVILFAYAILPWTGIMLIGYACGKLYASEFDAARRKRILRVAGLSLIGGFVFLRWLNGYGDPAPWAAQKNALYTFLSFLNTTKYPASLLFTCMTLGPGLLLLSFLENIQGAFIRFAKVYGKVPLFYFAGHFLLAHIICVILFYATGHHNGEIADPNSIFLFRPVNFGFSLGITYLVWIAVVLVMYYPCKWYGRYKDHHRQWWLSYL